MHLNWTAICLATVVFGGQATAGEKGPSSEVAVVKAQVLEQKAADKESIAPLPAAAAITKSEVQAVDPAGVAPVDDVITCLSRTIYWEAKGGSSTDMEDVANVILNRVGHDGFPGTVCEVVKQGKEKKACQFSWWCDGRSDQVQEDDRYTAAKEVARLALNQQIKDRTDGAMYFHDRNVHPSWIKDYIKTTETQTFVFYKPHDGKAK